MTRVFPSCLVVGEAFSPARVIWTGLPIVRDVDEQGDIGTKGRYVGVPIPYGSCAIEASDGPGDWSLLGDILMVLEGNIAKLREAGGTDIYLICNVLHDGQCNFKFSNEELLRLSKLGVGLAVPCYSDE